VNVTASSPVLSLENQPFYAYTQRVGVLIGNNFNDEEVRRTLHVLEEQGVFLEVISDALGTVCGKNGMEIKVDKPFLSTYEVLYDSLYIVGGNVSNQKSFNHHIEMFLEHAYNHYKPIGVATTATDYFHQNDVNKLPGAVFAEHNKHFAKDFVKAVAQQRFWNR